MGRGNADGARFPEGPADEGSLCEFGGARLALKIPACQERSVFQVGRYRHADVIAIRLRAHVRLNGPCWVTAALAPMTEGDREMPASKNTKQQVLENGSKRLQGRMADAVRKSGKSKGTRVGSLDDWREGGARSTGENSELGKRFRDGR
jgi:hypothetical protein